MIIAAGCSPRPTQLKVVNRSDHFLSNLSISSEPTEMKMGSIMPNQSLPIST